MRTRASRASRASRTSRTRIALTAALLLGLCGPAAGCALQTDTDTDTKPIKPSPRPVPEDARKRLWKVDTGLHSLENQYSSPVLWATDTAVVMFKDGALRGLDPRNGHQLWAVRAPEGTHGLCDHAERTDAAGVGVVAYQRGRGAHGTCDRLAAVDTTHGRQLWSKRLSRPLESQAGSVLAVGDRAVAAALECGETPRYAIRSGRPLPKARGRSGECEAQASAKGHRIVAFSHRDDPDRGRLTAYDVDSGKDLWQQGTDGSERLEGVVTDKPLTLGLQNDSGEGAELRFYDSHGTMRGAPGNTGQLKLPPYVKGKQGRMLAGKTMDAAGPPPTSDDPVAGFDSRTGRQAWSWKDRGFAPAGVEGNRLLGTSPSKRGTRLQSVDLRTGHRTDKGGIPPVHRSIDSELVGSAGIDSQRVYLTQETGDDKVYLTAYELPR